MEEKTLRELLAKRIYLELQLFKYEILSRTKEDIYQASYQIETVASFYEILLGNIGSMDKCLLIALLCQDCSVLEALYEKWLKKEDSIYEELRAYVDSELAKIQEKYLYQGKEEEDGTERNPALKSQ